MTKSTDKIKLPLSIKFDDEEFYKTGYTGINRSNNKKVYEYRTENDSKRLWSYEDGNYYED